MGRKLLMALWWHFCVSKDRKTQSRNRKRNRNKA